MSNPITEWNAMLRGWRNELRDLGVAVTELSSQAVPARLRQPNFVTDERVGWTEFADGTMAEISTGMFLSQRLWGVSLPSSTDDRNGVFESLVEVAEHVNGVAVAS